MRILILTHEPGRGGTEKAAVSTAVALKNRGHEVRFLCTRRSEGVRAETLTKSAISLALVTESNVEAVLQDLNRWSPELVNIHLLSEDFPLLEFLRKALPASKFVETNVFSDTKDYCRNYDYSLQLSEWCLLNYHLRQPLVKKLPSQVVPYPVPDDGLWHDPDAGVHFRRSLGIGDTDQVIGRLGQMSEPKWSKELVTVFSRLAELTPTLWLVLVGAPSSIVEAVDSLKASLRARVILLPYIDTVEGLRAFYNMLDVFVHLANIGESFGYVVAEALLCEVPVVTMATPDSDNTQVEVVPHRVAGLVANDVEEFIHHCLYLLDHPRVGIDLGRRGRSHVLSQYSPELVARKIERIGLETTPKRETRKSPALWKIFCIMLGNLGHRPHLRILWMIELWLRLCYPRRTKPFLLFELVERSVCYVMNRLIKLERISEVTFHQLFEKKVKATRSARFKQKTQRQMIFSGGTATVPEWRLSTFQTVYQRASRVEEYPEAWVFSVPQAGFYMGSEHIFSDPSHVYLGIPGNTPSSLVGETQTNPPIKVKVSGSVANLTLSGLESNYYHFVTEFMARWHLLRRSGTRANYFVIDASQGFQREWFDILGVPVDRILRLPKGAWVEADTVIATSLINNWEVEIVDGFVHYQKKYLPSWFHSVHNDLRPKTRPQEGKKLYVSRSRAKYRRATNDDELRTLLENIGFVSLDLEKYSVREQIELFQSASVVVGIHGAGLVNINFCPLGTKVVEILSPNYIDSSFHLLSSALNLEYRAVLGIEDLGQRGVDPQQRNLTVDLLLLQQVLQTI